MLRGASLGGQCVNNRRSLFEAYTFTLIFRRAVTTNTAIHRGLRKSKPGSGRGKYPTLGDGERDALNVVSRSGRFPQRQDRSSRAPKPYRRRTQDAEIARAYEGLKKDSQEPRRESYSPHARRPESSWKLGRGAQKNGEHLAGKYARERTSRPERYEKKLPSFRPQDRTDSSEEPFQPGSRFGNRSSSDRPRSREDAFRKQVGAFERHGNGVGSESAKSRESSYWRIARDLNENESNGPQGSSLAAPANQTRAERRRAMYGLGDTALGGVPRSKEAYEEGRENALRHASRKLRDAAKYREWDTLSPGGLAAEAEAELSNDASSQAYEGDSYREGSKGQASNRDIADFRRSKSSTPLSIPYTTPASEFLYGRSAISAALNANRRKMYKLYVYCGENRDTDGQQASIRKLALAQGVKVIEAKGDSLRLMDKMSDGRPHNVSPRFAPEIS